MTEAELLRRTKQFGLRVIRLVVSLPNSAVARPIGSQLIRAGTAVGANYRAACRARSKAEFRARLGVVEEEADESAYWMELWMEAGLMPEKKLTALHNEAEQLSKIMAASRISIANRKLQIANA